MRRIVYRLSAERDLARIYRHIAHESDSEDVADRFTERLTGRRSALASLPGTLGTCRDALWPGLRSVSEGRYLILFRYGPGNLSVVNIVRSARNVRAMFPRP